jgi:hypothetical protein
MAELIVSLAGPSVPQGELKSGSYTGRGANWMLCLMG